MKTLYHGSHVAVPEPLARAGRKNLDFGRGFYLTSIITAEQALGQLRYKKVNHQLCILNQSVIDRYLTFTGSIILQGKEEEV